MTMSLKTHTKSM